MNSANDYWKETLYKEIEERIHTTETEFSNRISSTVRAKMEEEYTGELQRTSDIAQEICKLESDFTAKVKSIDETFERIATQEKKQCNLGKKKLDDKRAVETGLKEKLHKLQHDVEGVIRSMAGFKKKAETQITQLGYSNNLTSSMKPSPMDHIVRSEQNTMFDYGGDTPRGKGDLTKHDGKEIYGINPYFEHATRTFTINNDPLNIFTETLDLEMMARERKEWRSMFKYVDGESSTDHNGWMRMHDLKGWMKLHDLKGWLKQQSTTSFKYLYHGVVGGMKVHDLTGWLKETLFPLSL